MAVSPRGNKKGRNARRGHVPRTARRSGTVAEHVEILGRTRDWLRYDVPKQWIRREWRSTYKGQKQIWFLLRLVGRDSDVSLRASDHPEFDAWRWNDYWVPLGDVIDFKRQVYASALVELARHIFVDPAARVPRWDMQRLAEQ